ncbi:helix-turn-helix domain-containing protein [Pectobacterium polaris]|uniref:helix-turn-helix domain-containing protein n=1 Tax=Pectobacterium polaris TaxID=2042057 RepID=UPI000B1D3C77|nr:helix-turn-helix domain-containing protein [Pectobacterium polaris]ASY78384.1 MerR family transcriptional regulator [Pectobacterium polaris]MCL6324865.1 MerR family transcriptional regulator [Pectobacterium polaris]
MKFLDIGEIAEKSGIKPSALRYYEEIGLITSVFRHGLRRQFPADVLLQLRLITMGKSAGFSLQEIAGMFNKDGMPDLPRIALHKKADEIDRQIHELKILRDTLRHVADCSAPSHMECPTFRKLVETTHRRGQIREKTSHSATRKVPQKTKK